MVEPALNRYPPRHARTSHEGRRIRRSNKGVPEAVYGSPDRPLQIGGMEIQCFVLDDETRVLTQGSFLEAIGRHRRPNTRPQLGEERVPATPSLFLRQRSFLGTTPGRGSVSNSGSPEDAIASCGQAPPQP